MILCSSLIRFLVLFIQKKVRAIFGDCGLLLLDLERITSVQKGKYKVPSIKWSDSGASSKLLVFGIKSKQRKNNRRIKVTREKRSATKKILKSLRKKRYLPFCHLKHARGLSSASG